MLNQNYLRTWRVRLGFSMQELGARAGVSPATVNTIERNGHLPGEDVRVRIAAALDVSETTLWPNVKGVDDGK